MTASDLDRLAACVAPELTQADRDRLADAMARLLAAWWRQQQAKEATNGR